MWIPGIFATTFISRATSSVLWAIPVNKIFGYYSDTYGEINTNSNNFGLINSETKIRAKYEGWFPPLKSGSRFTTKCV